MDIPARKSVLRELNAYVRQLLLFSSPQNNRLEAMMPFESMYALISVIDSIIASPIVSVRHERNNHQFLLHVRESIRALLGVDEVSTFDTSHNVLYVRLDILSLIVTVCYSQAWSAYVSRHVVVDYVDYITSISLFSDITLTSSRDMSRVLSLEDEVSFVWLRDK